MESSDIIEFLRESNAIEGVYDDESLAQAEVAWKYLIGQKKMTTGVVLKTHKILMLNQKGLRPNERGYFRTVPVWVGRRTTLKPILVPGSIEMWCRQMNKPPELEDDWQALHVEYERIHPFIDGNGRTGRMFMNWYRLKNGMPILVVYADERWDYYRWFEEIL